MAGMILHEKSKACLKTELDLFTLPPTQASILEDHHVYHQPLSTLTDEGPIEFFLSGTGEEYTDLGDIMLYVKCQVLTPDGRPLPPDANVAPRNNLLHTLWSQIDCSLNDTLITTSSSTYAHKAYLQTLLTSSTDAARTHLQPQFWHRDIGQVNSTDENENFGYRARRGLSSQSRPIEMLGKLHVDLFQQPKLLINNVSMRLKLVRNPDSFCLGAEPTDPVINYKIHLLEVGLYVRKCKINPSIQAAHLQALQHTPAKYPLNRTVTKVFTEPANSLSINKENLFLGQLPHRVTVGVLHNEAYHGSYQQNPFNFHHYNVNFICLHLDGRAIPSKPLRPNFQDNTFIRAYQQLMEALGKTDSVDSNTISPFDFARGFTLFVFDLTPDQAGDADHLNLIKNGTLRLELHFGAALPHTVTVLVQGEFKNLLEIDKFRNVMVDYSN